MDKEEKWETEEKQKEEKEVVEIGKKEKGDLMKKVQANPWFLIALILGILVIILFLSNSNFSGRITGKTISADEAGEILLNFYEENGIENLSIESIEEVSGLYQVNFNFQNKTIPIFITKDGKFSGSLMPLIIPEEADQASQQQPQQPADVPKSDKPKVELFVMTYCPYGTQAEKGIIPVIKSLGNAIDAKIRFVHYFMHGDKEEQETNEQVCIREEQSAKYLSYLECFLEDGDSDRCLTKTGIDKAKMEKCISSGKAGEYYAKDSELSQNAGVSGSPTLVINGQIVQSGRSPASYLDTICFAFNEAPSDKCAVQLSSATPSPGFGSGTSGSSGTAQC